MTFCQAKYKIMSITKPVMLITQGMSEGANQVASASGQVSSASQSLAEGPSFFSTFNGKFSISPGIQLILAHSHFSGSSYNPMISLNHHSLIQNEIS